MNLPVYHMNFPVYHMNLPDYHMNFPVYHNYELSYPLYHMNILVNSLELQVAVQRSLVIEYNSPKKSTAKWSNGTKKFIFLITSLVGEHAFLIPTMCQMLHVVIKKLNVFVPLLHLSVDFLVGSATNDPRTTQVQIQIGFNSDEKLKLRWVYYFRMSVKLIYNKYRYK